MDPKQMHDLVDSYIAAWNARDPQERREVVTRTFREDAVYVDPMAEAAGAEAIDELIAAVQQQFPDHRFAADGAPDGHHDRLRFGWVLADGDAPPVARGLDVAVIADDGRMAGVTGFLEPAA
jgi:SnoaL-like domain